MSGDLDFAPARRFSWFAPRRVPPGPIEKKLALEDHTRIYRSLGAGQVAGAWFIAWAFTVQVMVPRELYPVVPDIPDPGDPPEVTFVIPDGKTARPPEKRLPNQSKGPLAASRKPSKEEGRIQVKVLETRQTEGWADKVYSTLKNIGRGVDQEKIEIATRLTRTEPTRLSGRPGVKREEFNQGYFDGDGTGDPYDMSATSLPDPGLPDRMPGTGTRNPGAMVKESSIQVSSEERFRSSEEILAVVRSHAPGLRHLYNTHLKRSPGLGGKVTVRFAISPSGLVVDAAIADGTTGSRGFEAEVLARVRTWRFGAIDAHGNDIVTVPFNFSE